MNYYLLENLSLLESLSKRISEKSLLKSNQWRLINENEEDKIIFIFKPDGKLYISTNGDVNRNLSWEYLNNGDIIMDIEEGKSNLFKCKFLDDALLVLKKDNSDLVILFVNEKRYSEIIKSFNDILEYINNQYLFQTELPLKSNNYVLIEDRCPACNTIISDIDITNCSECGLEFL